MNSPDSADAAEKNATQNAAQTSAQNEARNDAYWSKSLMVVVMILAIWAFISLGCGILFRETLDAAFSVGGAPLGFWIAQQGAIIGFLLLLVLYMVLMNRIDNSHGFGEGEDV